MYLFKRAADGVWIFGKTADSECPAGNYRIEPSSDRTKVTFYHLQTNTELQPADILVSSILKENDAAYASFAELKAAYAGFFFRVSAINSAAGMVVPDSSTGFKLRMILRGSAICFDKEITSTGFAGTLDVDWKECGSFGSDV